MKLTFSTFWALALSCTAPLISAPTEIPRYAPAEDTEALYPRANHAHLKRDLTAAIPLYRAAWNIVWQNGHAAPIVFAPVSASSFARVSFTLVPFSSPKNTSPPPAPQQKLRS